MFSINASICELIIICCQMQLSTKFYKIKNQTCQNKKYVNIYACWNMQYILYSDDASATANNYE